MRLSIGALCNIENIHTGPFFSLWSRLHILLLPKVESATVILLFASTLFMAECEQIDNESYVEYFTFQVSIQKEVHIKIADAKHQ
jgi:hypothetical protein